MQTYSASDMLGIHPSIICHKLAICPQAKLVSQKKRKMKVERRRAVKEEVDKLFKANFIREVRYSTWLANVIMVKKANDKWQICIGYTDLLGHSPRMHTLCATSTT